MRTVEQVELHEHPTQEMSTSALKKTDTLFHKFLTLLVLGGACCVIALYLVIPLMIFLNIFQDWITQLLCAVLILTIGELLVFSILVKTSKATKVAHSTKHTEHEVRRQGQENDQHMVTFDELVNAPTVHVAALKSGEIEAQAPSSDEIANATTVHMSQLKHLLDKPVLRPSDLLLDEEPTTRSQEEVPVN
ncbi:hypothetical protein [Dictyobacter kobayashii]|uniref:Uncharacterized protein n=1 Tax=Dictyobacter kobayashii TaxID=2014872 RepID=A0A402ANR2_9CHLR|nr:hypothetical protein [Dictyobacter kobayashii]GCE20841.1 hypothetical protein KDK_46410 [Dictyobacter kobayashii]